LKGIDMNDLFFNRDGGYGIIFQEYKGKYSLIAGKQTENGIYKDWVFLSKWKNGEPTPDDKKRPMGVYFGNKEKFIEALEFFLEALKQ